MIEKYIKCTEEEILSTKLHSKIINDEEYYKSFIPNIEKGLINIPRKPGKIESIELFYWKDGKRLSKSYDVPNGGGKCYEYNLCWCLKIKNIR